jgi:hypothetical protein
MTEHVLFVQYPGLYIEDGTEPTYLPALKRSGIPGVLIEDWGTP